MKNSLRNLIAAASVAIAFAPPAGAATTKDIVIERIAAAPAPSAAPAAGDALAVSVLLESSGGTLVARSTDTLFRTGDRLRIKLLASRDARVSLYNTNPRGETGGTPIWQGDVKQGQETISPRLALSGTSGVDQLHIVMEPAGQHGMAAWLGDWLRDDGDGKRKDIGLDVQNSGGTTYLLNNAGQGLVNTVKIVHTSR